MQSQALTLAVTLAVTFAVALTVGDASTALLRIFGAGNKQVCLWKHVIKRRPIMLYAIG